MRHVRAALFIAFALVVALIPGPAWSEVTADVFIEGLDVSAEDVERLENGDVLASPAERQGKAPMCV
jgi:hypothetical protein